MIGWFALTIQLLKKLPELLKIAEEAFDDIPDSGAEKKEMVTAAINAIVSGVIGDEVWERVKKIIFPIIDIMCSFFFPHIKDKDK